MLATHNASNIALEPKQAVVRSHCKIGVPCACSYAFRRATVGTNDTLILCSIAPTYQRYEIEAAKASVPTLLLVTRDAPQNRIPACARCRVASAVHERTEQAQSKEREQRAARRGLNTPPPAGASVSPKRCQKAPFFKNAQTSFTITPTITFFS